MHPWLSAWLRASPADCSLGLEPLADAAAIDLANQQLGGPQTSQLTAALFALAGRLLVARALTHESEQLLRALGQYTAELERAASDIERDTTASGALAGTPATTAEASARASALQVAPALQPPIVPLLVWTALAERKAVRRTAGERRRAPGGTREFGGRFDLLTDNFIAWRAARAALRGRYRANWGQK